MEQLLVLVALILLAVPILIVVLLVGQMRLRRRVAELESRIGRSVELAGGAERTAVWGPDRAQPDISEAGSEPEIEPEAPPAAAVIASRKADTARTDETEPTRSIPRAFVFRQDRMDALTAWLRENWFYAVSAVSLALAGIFLVQYGVENGLLPPAARVVAALVFGAALIVAGEYVRRRFGDGRDSATAHLPSVFSGAGLVTLFGSVLSARLLYGLIGPEAALAGMVGVALAGLILGWYHGPLLAAVALIGALSAPFMVGGSSADPGWLYGYFGIVTLLGLGIDTVRRWAWISVLSLAGAFATGWLLHAGSPATTPEFLLFVTAVALGAIAIPNRRLFPDHAGPMISELVRPGKNRRWPDFPTRLALGSVAVSVWLIATAPVNGEAEFWLAVSLLGGLALALIFWANRAPALEDATLLPAAGLLWFVFTQGLSHGAVYRQFSQTYQDTSEADYPAVLTILVAIAALISVAAAWRSFGPTRWSAIWAGAATLFAPAMAILIEIGWTPSQVIGAYPWALHAAALAALMVVLAERFARVDGEHRLRTALAVLSALSCLAFAFVIILTSAALTVALAATVVAAAALDRRFGLFPMTWFIAAGVVTLGFRLVIDPGLDWAESAPIADMLFAYGGTLAAFVVATWLIRPLERPLSNLMLDSAAWSTAGVFVSLLLYRWLDGLADAKAVESHWSMGLGAVIWLSLAFAQVQRMAAGGPLRKVRIALAGIFGMIGAVALLAGLTVTNPVAFPDAAQVLGPPVINTLAVAYLLPAAVIALALWRLNEMPPPLRLAGGAVAVGLSAVWLGMAIRHFWQGAAGMDANNGVTQPELYTYTIVLLIIGAGLFYQSLARRSDLMRKAGLAVIGLAVAKVFLIDIAGLGGLIRVFSLLALGLSLAGLAWLNRWAQIRHARPSGQDPEPLDH